MSREAYEPIKDRSLFQCTKIEATETDPQSTAYLHGGHEIDVVLYKGRNSQSFGMMRADAIKLRDELNRVLDGERAVMKIDGLTIEERINLNALTFATGKGTPSAMRAFMERHGIERGLGRRDNERRLVQVVLDSLKPRSQS